MIYHIPGLESEQRHSGHAKRSDGHFARLTRSYRQIIVIQEFDNQQFRLEMAAIEILAVRERVLHLGGCISGI